MSEREHVHQLIDLLPESQISSLVQFLETIVDPAALVDDEPITEEDRVRFREGRARLVHGKGASTTMEDVLAEFGLKPEHFPLHK
jgi:hypothetical protein